MAAPSPLPADQIHAALAELPGWTYEDQALTKTYLLGDFTEAVSFMVRMAFHAEALNHHPELANVYNRVSVTLKTHDAGDQVTQLDVDLARRIEGFAWV
ncbi:MAG: 4a-hydroxytetrahydrobiopterin dehydratase [Bacteroidota bacterium]